MAKINFISELDGSVTVALDVHPDAITTYGELRRFLQATAGNSDDDELSFLVDPNYGAEASCHIVSPVELPSDDA